MNDNSPIEIKEFQKFAPESKVFLTGKTSFGIKSLKKKIYNFDIIEVNEKVIESYFLMIRRNKEVTRKIENKKILLINSKQIFIRRQISFNYFLLKKVENIYIMYIY
jgi:hypothetical protein